MRRFLTLFAFFCVTLTVAYAQMSVKLVSEKKNFLSGEANYVRLTITNNSGKPVTLESDSYNSWLDIHVEHSNGGAQLPQSRFVVFPKLSIPTGGSVSKRIDLRHFYDLSREGNYNVRAVVKMPNKKDMYASQKQFFSVREGAPMWSQSTLIPGSSKKCRFSVCTVAERGIQKLYVQTRDPENGVAYNAVCVGNWLGTSRPQCLVDGKANLHVFFPTTPAICAYARINYRGTLEKLQYYKKDSGMPGMTFLPDGSIRIYGAQHFDPTVKPKPVPDAADIPGM